MIRSAQAATHHPRTTARAMPAIPDRRCSACIRPSWARRRVARREACEGSIRTREYSRRLALRFFGQQPAERARGCEQGALVEAAEAQEQAVAVRWTSVAG